MRNFVRNAHVPCYKSGLHPSLAVGKARSDIGIQDRHMFPEQNANSEQLVTPNECLLQKTTEVKLEYRILEFVKSVFKPVEYSREVIYLVPRSLP